MTIYRHKLDSKLYLIYHVTPPKHTGCWYECVPFMHDGNQRKLSAGGKYSWKNFTAAYVR